VDVQEANVELPQYGEKLPATVSRLGMTTAKEVFGDEARNPDQKVLMVFFQTEDGVKGQKPLALYAHPSSRSDIAKFVRKFGQPKIGLPVGITRDEKGYWILDL
jgi:hypothetical protein